MTKAETCVFQGFIGDIPGFTPPGMEGPQGTCYGLLVKGTNTHQCCYQATVALFQAADRSDWPMLTDELITIIKTDKTDSVRRKGILAALEKLDI